jgi:ABC-type Fe3+-hydroxamate transport system substrate-binding protein
VLNRAEWVKFVAVFFNKEVEAERLFSSIRSDYQKLNSSARAAAGADAKTVTWLTQFGDTITVNFAEYKKQYMEVGTSVVLVLGCCCFVCVSYVVFL